MASIQTRRARLMAHFETYPRMTPQDIFKYLYQSAFGCEHLLTNEDAALTYIKNEYAAIAKTQEAHIDALDGAYCRVPLAYLDEGLRAETLARLFFLSAKEEATGKAALTEGIEIAKALIVDGTLPLRQDEFEDALAAWRDAGFPPVHHSADFRAAYHPAYRVIRKEYAALLPLFIKIDRLLATAPRATVAIEGGSASGKSTLSSLLPLIYDCNVIHMDDFFLRPEQRTPERFAEIGGNIDRERFAAQVLPALCAGDVITYQRFDCSRRALGETVTLAPKGLTVVEGVYAMHPAFSRYYDLGLFLDITPEYQRERILVRNPTMAERFFNEWIPLENRYFLHTDIRTRADLILAAESTSQIF